MWKLWIFQYNELKTQLLVFFLKELSSGVTWLKVAKDPRAPKKWHYAKYKFVLSIESWIFTFIYIFLMWFYMMSSSMCLAHIQIWRLPIFTTNFCKFLSNGVLHQDHPHSLKMSYFIYTYIHEVENWVMHGQFDLKVIFKFGRTIGRKYLF